MAPTARILPWQRRLAALTEVIGVLTVGNVLALLARRALGLQGWKDTQRAMVDGELAVDFLLLARLASVDLLVKWGFLLGLAMAIRWWHRRRGPADFGLTTAGRSPLALVGIGVVLFAAAGLLSQLLQTVRRVVDLGEGPAHWALFPERLTAEFLVYMAVSSFLLVPVLEELYLRGYMQNRLVEDFGAGGGILIAALVFAFAHGQYYRLSAMSLGTLASLVVSTVIAGYVFHWTGSLVPTVVAHGLVNFPLPGSPRAELVVVVGMVTLLLIVARRLGPHATALARLFRDIDRPRATALWALLAVSLVAALTRADALALILGVAAFVVALALDSRERRANRVAMSS